MTGTDWLIVAVATSPLWIGARLVVMCAAIYAINR